MFISRLSLVMVVCFSLAVSDAQAQCGEPDLSQIVLDDADIFAISGNDLITVIASPFPDDSLIGHWVLVEPIPSDDPDFTPQVFFRIVGNEHFQQGNISVFSTDQDLESQPAWVFYEVTTFDIVAAMECIDCVSDDDCDDGDACTADTCDLFGDEVCVFTAIDCDDGNACTADSCVDGVCENDAISCDDGNDCTIDSCDSGSGCSSTPVNCDDGDACTADSCLGGVCSNDPICGAADGCCDPSCDPGSDPDCFVCAERGESCSSNSDCCSGRCKRNGRCR